MYGGEFVVLGTKDEFMQSQHPESLAFMACLPDLKNA